MWFPWLLRNNSNVFSITLAFDSNLYGYKMDHSSIVTVSEFYKIDSYPVIKQHFASWNSSNGFADSPEDIWLRRSNLMVIKLITVYWILNWNQFFWKGQHLRVQTLNYYEHIKMGSMQPDGTYIPTGIFAEVFYHLQVWNNFTYSKIILTLTIISGHSQFHIKCSATSRWKIWSQKSKWILEWHGQSVDQGSSRCW